MTAFAGFQITLITSIVTHLFAPPQTVNQTFRLYPGIYSVGSSGHVQIVRKGQRFCLTALSRDEATFASIRPDHKRPGLYRINGLAGVVLYQQDGNTILWGQTKKMTRGTRDRQKEQTNLPIANDLQRCLNSNKPFFSKGKG